MLWSMLIFSLSATVMGLRLLQSFELRLLDLPLDTRSFRGAPAEDPDYPFVLFSLWAPLPPADYLRHCVSIVGDLKKAGAKGVLIPLPVDMPWIPKVKEQIEELQKSGIVVFGMRLRELSTSSPAGARMLDNPKNWWVRHPVFHHIDLFWGVLSARFEVLGTIYRFLPTQYRESNRGEPVPDASLQLLKRHFGYPDDLEIQQGSYRVRFGSHTIPLSTNGYVYVKRVPLPRPAYSVFAVVSPEIDSLQYMVSTFRRNEKNPSLEAGWKTYKNKIVILDWPGMGDDPFVFPSPGQVYQQILNAVVTNSYVTLMDEWNLLLIFLAVAIMAGLGYATRGWVLFISSILLSAGFVWFTRWLLGQHNIIMDPLYVLLPILLCGVLLPIVKLSGEKKIAEETVGELREELKRLEGLHRG